MKWSLALWVGFWMAAAVLGVEAGAVGGTVSEALFAVSVVVLPSAGIGYLAGRSVEKG